MKDFRKTRSQNKHVVAPLSTSHIQTLVVLCNYVEKHDTMPKIQDVANSVGKERSTVAKYYTALVQDGFLKKTRINTQRSKTPHHHYFLAKSIKEIRNSFPLDEDAINCFLYICEYARNHNVMPSKTEVKKYLNMRMINVKNCYKALNDKGFLVRDVDKRGKRLYLLGQATDAIVLEENSQPTDSKNGEDDIVGKCGAKPLVFSNRTIDGAFKASMRRHRLVNNKLDKTLRM